MNTDVPGLLGISIRATPIKIDKMRAAMAAQLENSSETREALEDAIDWDLGPFLEEDEHWTSVYTLDFLKRLSTAIELSYEEVLAALRHD